jgi:hypothetical protein
MSLVAILYDCERRPVFPDHIFGTGLTWNHGESRLVSEVVARRMLKHPEFKVDDAGTSLRAFDVVDDTLQAQPVKKEDDEHIDFPHVALDQMSRDELKVFAKRNFGIDLPEKGKLSSKTAYIDTIRRTAGVEFV